MLVFLLEEPSMKEFLDGFLPRILPPSVVFKTIPHEGKTDLEKSIPRKLRAWQTPGARFVVIRDQDSADCVDVKRRLRELCVGAGRDDARVCVACKELEAWFLGDLLAVGEAFGDARLAGLQDKAKFRAPDRLGSPNRELAALIPGYGKVSGARRLGPLLRVEGSRSPSFRYFVKTVRELVRDA